MGRWNGAMAILLISEFKRTNRVVADSDCGWTPLREYYLGRLTLLHIVTMLWLDWRGKIHLS